MRVIGTILAALVVVISGCIDRAELEVTYIANAGFFLKTNEHTVLIDGVFGFSEGTQLPWAPDIDALIKMERAEPPFENLDLVFATHAHMDHFDAISVGRLLTSSPKTQLVCPVTVQQEIKEFCPDWSQFQSQICVLPVAWGNNDKQSINGISITSLGMHHSGDSWYDLEHLAFLIEMDGHTVLHLGDALPTPDNLEPFSWLAKKNTDLALVPYWTVEDNGKCELLQRILNPRFVMLMHIEPSDVDLWSSKITVLANQFPNVGLFKEKMERRTFR